MTPKRLITVSDAAVAYAEKLWTDLATQLFSAQNSIVAIIDAKAWEPLGYESFSKAWIDRIMADITIASELRPHVVYQMFSEGMTTEQVAAAVKGISVDTAESLKSQRAHGVPPDQASVTVRRHHRARKTQSRYLHLELDHETLTYWRDVAGRHDIDLKDLAIMCTGAIITELDQ